METFLSTKSMNLLSNWRRPNRSNHRKQKPIWLEDSLRFPLKNKQFVWLLRQSAIYKHLLTNCHWPHSSLDWCSQLATIQIGPYWRMVRKNLLGLLWCILVLCWICWLGGLGKMWSMLGSKWLVLNRRALKIFFKIRLRMDNFYLYSHSV